MKLKKLRLENIRSHKNTEIEFREGTTVFTGRTGSGKSSILMGVQYALFGSDSGINNYSMLRRGKSKGKIELEFEEGDGVYNIVRGLKRSGNNITVDVSNMAILKDGTPLPLIGRANDLNEKVLDILNYPKDIKARELFEITSYTKQDEIRALIELKPEKRQEHIDKILQLAKYKTTWENMKDVVSYFDSKLGEDKARLENLEKNKEELVEYQAKAHEIKEKIISGEKEIERLKEHYNKIIFEVRQLSENLEVHLKKRRQSDELRGKVLNIESDIKIISKQIEILEKRKDSLELKQKEFDSTEDPEVLQERYAELSGIFGAISSQLEKNKSDLKKLKEIGAGTCPTCKQEITNEHISSVELEYSKVISALSLDMSDKERDIKEIKDNIQISKQAREINESLEKVMFNLKERIENKKLKSEELEKLEAETEISSLDCSDYEKIKKELDEKQVVEKEVFSMLESHKKVNLVLRTELNEINSRLVKKEEEIRGIEDKKEALIKHENALITLQRLREDIRNIREIVRRNFLEDFRQEFQKKFEEIRKFDDDYTVDVKSDYEPVAFVSGGEEVPISSMSGGEKTSVALAYRLALSDLAAQISSIRQSEILILDEPTVGFDTEDIKVLPEALNNIKTIPQIIIVTHEEELKSAADYKFKVDKFKGMSRVEDITS